MNSTTEPPSHEEAEIDVFLHPARAPGPFGIGDHGFHAQVLATLFHLEMT